MVVDKCSMETKLHAILMAFVTLLTYVFGVKDNCKTNHAADHLMSTSCRDKDCLPFMLEDCVCLDAMVKF